MLVTVDDIFFGHLIVPGIHDPVLYHILYLFHAGSPCKVAAFCDNAFLDRPDLVEAKLFIFRNLCIGLAYGADDLYTVKTYFFSASFDDLHDSVNSLY